MENPLNPSSYFSSITILGIVFCLFISLEFTISEARNKNDGFSIDLFHRDSPESPLYDHKLTHSQRLTNCLIRSFRRYHHFHHVLHKKKSNSNYSAAIIPDHGEYLMRIFLGNPPIETWGIADTGSDLIWTQCKPCIKCFNQKYELFNPSKSSTYGKVSCNTTCDTLEYSICNTTTKTCTYSAVYGDKSYSHGEIAKETLRLSPKVAFPNVTIGCAHSTGGLFSSSSSGIIGLGGGNSSFVSQIRSRIGGKFSYCLVDFNKNATSKLNFGMRAIVHGKDVLTTPIIKTKIPTFYFLTLEGISVGKKRLKYISNQEVKNSKENAQEENIIIDSGTTLTILPFKMYDQAKAEVQRYINKTTTKDPDGVLDLCYSSLSEHEFPKIIMHFKGADVELNNINAFIGIGKNITCFAFAGSFGISIYGNIAQINFLVGYDLEKKTVSFKRTQCDSDRVICKPGLGEP